MGLKSQFRLVILGSLSLLLWPALVMAGETTAEKLNREFQSAVAAYDAGRFAEAAAHLEALLPHMAGNFEVHELLGLVYAAQSQDARAVDQLQTAVRLKPDSAEARTNLAASLAHSGKPGPAEEQFRKALALEPRDYEANHDLGEFYIQQGKIADGRPFLDQAQRIQPSSYGNGYDLAQADLLTGRLAEARQVVQSLVPVKDAGELHDLLAQIEEKDGKFVAAANEYEIAAHMDPSEDNLFDWGSELLLHRTYEPAIEVFQQAVQRYPNSPRLLIGLGMALYSQSRYDEAVKALVAAADIDPTDARCYLFLSKASSFSPLQADAVIERFRRYAELQPGNARAKYYYAMALWKGKQTADVKPDLHAVESLLQQSISLDGSLPETHLQLGILYADQHEFARSLPEYERALELDANLPDAHYRLGQYYAQAGQKERAQQEFDSYQKLRAQHLEAKDRAEVQQFVYSAKAAPAKP